MRIHIQAKGNCVSLAMNHHGVFRPSSGFQVRPNKKDDGPALLALGSCLQTSEAGSNGTERVSGELGFVACDRRHPPHIDDDYLVHQAGVCRAEDSNAYCLIDDYPDYVLLVVKTGTPGLPFTDHYAQGVDTVAGEVRRLRQGRVFGHAARIISHDLLVQMMPGSEVLIRLADGRLVETAWDSQRLQVTVLRERAQPRKNYNLPRLWSKARTAANVDTRKWAIHQLMDIAKAGDPDGWEEIVLFFRQQPTFPLSRALLKRIVNSAPDEEDRTWASGALRALEAQEAPN